MPPDPAASTSRAWPTRVAAEVGPDAFGAAPTLLNPRWPVGDLPLCLFATHVGPFAINALVGCWHPDCSCSASISLCPVRVTTKCPGWPRSIGPGSTITPLIGVGAPRAAPHSGRCTRLEGQTSESCTRVGVGWRLLCRRPRRRCVRRHVLLRSARVPTSASVTEVSVAPIGGEFSKVARVYLRRRRSTEAGVPRRSHGSRSAGKPRPPSRDIAPHASPLSPTSMNRSASRLIMYD